MVGILKKALLTYYLDEHYGSIMAKGIHRMAAGSCRKVRGKKN
jgi:hypothetical protein